MAPTNPLPAPRTTEIDLKTLLSILGDALTFVAILCAIAMTAFEFASLRLIVLSVRFVVKAFGF